MKDTVKTIIGAIALFSAILLVVIWGSNVQKEINESIYNNGICTNCGGNYKFVNVSRNHDRVYYYYKCDSCDKIIELKK